ncbi:hypothetical protein EA187_01620 [Lujinxingia sediminis]|uniref:Uncharacterized protein n=1 Tax=Lujinxingia sediminis TaxID=2480984 RepID=A0ABY0CWU2_9DELT|nr:hypothetical protein [Lujinxingia sediminis]RVU48163.1 hypothetical protein EA187_01620 [Lujinxingia sediminis]
MKLNDTLKLLMVLLMSAGMATTTLTACGGDEPGETDVETDAGDEDTGGVDNDGGEEDTGPDADTGPGPDGTIDLVPPPARCGEEGASERCDEDPETFEFGAASKISALQIAGADCCFDLDGDGFEDNSLSLAGSLANGSLADGIADGSLSLILEHDGLTALEVGQEFNVNFLLGAESTADGEIIDPASFDSGVAPQAVLPNATIVDDGGVSVVEAGPGTVVIVLELFGLELSLAVRNAVISADVVAEESSLETGVTLENGRLGGLVLFQELVDTINNVTATCECLGNPEKLINMEAESACIEYTEAELAGCVDDESICGDIAENCSAVTSLAPALVVHDVDGDGEKDAISVGMTFEAEPAVIAGVEAVVAE